MIIGADHRGRDLKCYFKSIFIMFTFTWEEGDLTTARSRVLFLNCNQSLRNHQTILHAQYTAKNAQVVTISLLTLLQELVTINVQADIKFVWLATACDNKSDAICQQTCCRLIISTGLLQLLSTDKL